MLQNVKLCVSSHLFLEIFITEQIHQLVCITHRYSAQSLWSTMYQDFSRIAVLGHSL